MKLITPPSKSKPAATCNAKAERILNAFFGCSAYEQVIMLTFMEDSAKEERAEQVKSRQHLRVIKNTRIVQQPEIMSLLSQIDDDETLCTVTDFARRVVARKPKTAVTLSIVRNFAEGARA